MSNKHVQVRSEISLQSFEPGEGLGGALMAEVGQNQHSRDGKAERRRDKHNNPVSRLRRQSTEQQPVLHRPALTHNT